MSTSRTEWITSSNRFWCIKFPSNSEALNTYGRVYSPSHLTTYFSTPSPLSLQQDQQLVQRLYQEAALTLLPLEERNDGSALKDQFLSTLEALSYHLHATDPELYQHSLHVLYTVWWFLHTLHLPKEFIASVCIAALFHDLGKLSIPVELLQKPAHLTLQEREEVKKHPMRGAEMLLPIPALRLAALMVYHHHERWDGGGYPVGLQGTMIPLGARIISIADAFSVMISRRVYHAPCSLAEALAELSRCAGTQFDPLLVEHFSATLNADLFHGR